MRSGLKRVYDIASVDEAEAFYDRWAPAYEAELAEAGYVTPRRCAGVLADFADDPHAPLAEFGCGTGLGGEALRDAGFTTLDGYDLSGEMLAVAADKDLYRRTATLDLAGPIDHLADEGYANAAAIGVFNPNLVDAWVLDRILRLLPPGGHFVFTLNDLARAERSFVNRLLELTDYRVAELISKEHGPHLPGTGLMSTVYLVRKL